MSLSLQLLKCHYINSLVPLKVFSPYTMTQKNNIVINILSAEEHHLSDEINYSIDYLMSLRSKTNYSIADYRHDLLVNICYFLDFLHSYDIIFSYKKIVVIYGAGLDNAFWNGSYFVFGNSLPPHKPLVSPCIVGHELGHAVIEQIAGLQYYGQSGALNESFADIFGVFFENFIHKKVGLGFQIGSECNFLLRDMKEPSKCNQPCKIGGSYYSTSSADNGGVHINSGIPNYIFYKLQLTLGLERTFEYFIYILHHLKPDSDFAEFKRVFLHRYRSEFIISIFDECIP